MMEMVVTEKWIYLSMYLLLWVSPQAWFVSNKPPLYPIGWIGKKNDKLF